jgi:DNA (cytosine-5)-methyltransferase 1
MDFIDLFCGGGFGARGAVAAGANPVLAIDCWSLATDTYQHNFPSCKVETRLIDSRVPLTLQKAFSCELLITSPECTSHSIARGARPPDEDSRETASHVIPWLKAFKPRWVILENVKRMEQWNGHDDLLNQMAKLGYAVSALWLNAADFGVPQSRKRLFLLGDREGTVTTRDDLLKLRTGGGKSVQTILDPPGTYKTKPLYTPHRARATLDRAERAIAELGEGEPFLIVYYGSDYAGGWQSLRSPLRTVTTLDRFALVTWENGEPHMRMLQPAELMRAMGGPNTPHKLPFGTRRDKVKLCGNGVCSPVMEVLVKRIMAVKGAAAMKRAS